LYTAGISEAILKRQNPVTKRIKPVDCSYLSDEYPKAFFLQARGVFLLRIPGNMSYA